MHPFTRNNLDIQTTPRAKLNSTEQTTTLMKLKNFQNTLHMIIDTS